MNRPIDDVGVGQAELDVQVREVVLQVLDVGGEQDQGGQGRRADRVALGDRLGGVADRVERVGVDADLRRQARHLGDAAGIVGHRAVGVEADDEAGQRQHGAGGDGDAVEAGGEVGGQDAGADHQHRQGRRLHRDGQALDDVGAVAGGRGLGDAQHRAVVDAGIVVGDPHQQAGDGQADQRAEVEVEAGRASGRVAVDRAQAQHQGRDREQRPRPRSRPSPRSPCRGRP